MQGGPAGCELDSCTGRFNPIHLTLQETSSAGELTGCELDSRTGRFNPINLMLQETSSAGGPAGCELDSRTGRFNPIHLTLQKNKQCCGSGPLRARLTHRAVYSYLSIATGAGDQH